MQWKRRLLKVAIKHNDKILRAEIKKAIRKKNLQNKNTDSFCRTEFAKQIRGKPFWIIDELEHQQALATTSGKCCFWHIIGLPEKEHLVGKSEDGKEILEKKKHPMYDYEIEVFESILSNRYVRIKKAAGMGITTLILGIMVYMCVRDDKFKGEEMGIVTGPRQDIANYELGRLISLLGETDYRPKKIGDTVQINGCKITAYPSHTFDTARGLDKCRFFLVDEADFFPETQIESVMAVLERYEAKSHPHVVLNSTSNLPTGLYAQMDGGKYSRFVTVNAFFERGLGKIYTEYEIEQAKKSSSFGREYSGVYGLGDGNIFPYQQIDACSLEFDIAKFEGGGTIAVDPGYGSSKFAIVAGVKNGDDLLITEAREYDRPSPSEMIDVIVQMSKKYSRIVVDDSNPGLITELRKNNLNVAGISFRQELSEMVMKAVRCVRERQVIIHPKFEGLRSQLKSVRFDEHGHPDKRTRSFDQVDAFLMLVYAFKQYEWYWVNIS